MAKRCSGERGNAWVLAGLAEVLQELPKGLMERAYYEELFIRLCTRIAGLQNEDGYWHASLLDPASYPSPKPVPPVSLYMRWPMA